MLRMIRHEPSAFFRCQLLSPERQSPILVEARQYRVIVHGADTGSWIAMWPICQGEIEKTVIVWR